MRTAFAVAIALILAGCGSGITEPTRAPSPTPAAQTPGQPTSGPTATPGAGPTDQPTASIGPGPTDAPTAPVPTGDDPLPQPSLTDAGQIAAALFDPVQVADGVVSLIAAMGVAVYDDAGTLVRPGGDQGAGELSLTETEVRGLISMTRDDLMELDPSGGPFPMSDFFKALQPSLPTGFTIGQLTSAFNDAYTATPDALAAQVMRGQTLGPDSGVLRIQEWLLLIDGFTPPAASALRGSGGRPGFARSGAQSLGVARQGLPGLTSPAAPLSNAEWVELLGALPTLAATIPFQMAGPGAFHEGHGAAGSPQRFLAAVGVAAPLISRNTGRTLLGAAPQPGVRVLWRSNNEHIWAKHGSFDPPLGTAQLVDPGQLSAAGEVFTPQEETANGVGTTLHDAGYLTARASQADLIGHSYDATVIGTAIFLASGTIAADGNKVFDIGWHEKGAGYSIDITWIDYYNGIADVVTFSGLADTLQSGSPGVDAYYDGSGAAFGSRPGWTSCNPGIDLVPSGFGAAEFGAGIQGDEVTIAAFPSIGNPLAGIFAGPFTLPKKGGSTSISTEADPGALCPHRFVGTIDAQPFGQP